MGVRINNFPEDDDNPNYIREYKGKNNPSIVYSGGYQNIGYMPADKIYYMLENRRLQIKEAIDSGKYQCRECGRKLNHQNKKFFVNALNRSASTLADSFREQVQLYPFDKIICDVCDRKEDAEYTESWARGHKILKRCKDCGAEFVPADSQGEHALRQYCPRCLAIRKHKDAVALGMKFRARDVANKQHLGALSKKKSSPKSRFQSLSEDRQRVIQLIKERNR